MKKIELQINGMTCHSCEILLERKFRKIHGVEKAKVDHASGKAEIFCTKDVPIEKFENVLKGEKYAISSSQNYSVNNDQKPDYSEIGAIFIIILGAYFFLNKFNLIPKFAFTENMTYGLVFLVGLVAAMSTCMAVTGGLLLGITAKYNSMHPNLPVMQKFRPHVYFNIGRVVSYALFGGLIGALGSVFSLSAKANGFLTIVISIVMILLGLQLLKIPFFMGIPSLMPKSFMHKIHDASEKQNKSGPFLFGASTFFLPCGFTQALQLYVLSTGSFIIGTLTMLTFSLATFPALVSVGAISSFGKGEFQKRFMMFAGALIILIGFFNINNGFVLSGISLANAFGTDAALQQDSNSKLIDGKQIAEMQIVGLDYSPHTFTVKKGIPVEWRIDATEARGCAQVVTVPKLGISKFLSPGINTISFVPKEAGTIEFSCSMGMTTRGSHFTVE